MAKFVYKTTNTINGRFYIGAHTGETDDDYLGSGVSLQRAVKKYGRDVFVREILEMTETDDELYAREQYYITKHIDDPLCYNLHRGGKGGWSYVQINGLNVGDRNAMRSPEVAAKMATSLRETHKQNPEKYTAIARANIKKAVAAVVGSKHSAERIERARSVTQQRWQHNYDKMCDAMSSTFEVISPDGDTFITRKLESFCAEHGLPYTTVWKTSILGRPCLRGRAKGWQCKRV